jgi:hypothetical protein
VSDRQAPEDRNPERREVVLEDVELGPGRRLVRLGAAVGVLADHHTGKTVEVPAVAEHGELAVDVTETEVDRLEQENRTARSGRAQPAEIATES